ncbi:MAG: hypothetical protein IKL02_10535 [Kiritimatiellae bacterium]|nr:hypothetical protein [Kiritimatiellia bacterium]
MKKMMMAALFAAMVAAVSQDAAASRSADWFPVSICLTMARPIPPFPCDNVAGLSLCLLSGEDCPVYGLQASCLSGCAESIYGVQTGAGYQCADDVYGLQIGGANVTTNLRGVQVGCLNGMRGCGFQVGAWNIVDQTSSVVQIGAMNSHFWKMDATQSSASSLQIGIANRADGGSRLQIGGINLSDDGSCFQIGILNFHNGWITPLLGWSFK